MGWKEKLARFMQGRYGVDAFSKFMLGAAIACMVLGMFFRTSWFDILGWALLLFTYVRMFSRNYAVRSAENQKYLEISGRVKAFFRGGPRIQSAKDPDHKVFKCPACGQKTRVPRGRGKIEIDCPRCHNKFIKRT